MKNIHVLSTSKPSRLYLDDNKEFQIRIATISNRNVKNQNIYITSNEEIKEGDWIFNIVQKTIFKADKSFLKLIGGTLLTNQKIILTTDQDLIKDDVQPIPDDFLEWFVKNPSCEEIKVEGHIYKGQDETEYKIIIPKEEPKQREVFFMNANETIDTRFIVEKMKPLQEQWQKEMDNALNTKQETLEEIAETFLPRSEVEHDTDFIVGFELGAKWQQERSYSEKDVKKLLISCKNQFSSGLLEDYHSDSEVVEWFEKNKKK